MALISCLECKGTVSTLALYCPHCGCPITKLKDPQNGTICIVDGVECDFEEALKHAIENKEISKFKGLRAISAVIDNLVYDTPALWDIMVKTQKVPETFSKKRNESPCESSQATTNIPKSPTCGSTNLTKKGVGARAIDGFFFGRLSVEGRSQFECRSCGYMW